MKLVRFSTNGQSPRLGALLRWHSTFARREFMIVAALIRAGETYWD